MKFLCVCVVLVFMLVVIYVSSADESDGDSHDHDEVTVEKRQRNSANRNKRRRGKGRKKKKIGGLDQDGNGNFSDATTENIFTKGYERFNKNFKKNPGNPTEDRKRRENFKRNAARVVELMEDTSKTYAFDTNSIFMFLSEDEKAALTGLSNVTAEGQSLPADKRRPTLSKKSKVISKSNERKNRLNVARGNGNGIGRGNSNGRKKRLIEEELEKRQDNTIPDELDLRTHNLVTGAKNQLDCGSCWAFAAVAALEGAFALATGLIRTFSDQSVIDCNTLYGCEGGFWTKAWKQIRDNQFIALQSDQEYNAQKGSCNVATTNGLTDVMNVGSWKVLREEDNEVGMLEYLNTYGPLTVALMADDRLYLYKSGIMNECLGGLDGGNHVVTLVGYAVDHLILKNSWGPYWGTDGYFKLQRDCGVQGYSYWASYVSVVNIGGGQAPFETEDQNLNITLVTSTGKLRTTLQLEEGVLIGDIFHFEIPETTTKIGNFNVRLIDSDGNLVYFLYSFMAKSGRYCRARTVSAAGVVEKNVRVKCPLSTGTFYIVDISVTSAGYFTNVGPTSFPLYTHLRPFELITTLFLSAGNPDLFSMATRLRTVIKVSSAGDPVLQTCYDLDGTCADILEEGLGSCSKGDAAEWMQVNCERSCGLCKD